MLLLGAATLMVEAKAAHAADSCATFFWTAAQQSPVERYDPRYLIGEGLEDVHMEKVVGTRIRYKWSTQAATCIASSNHYGYFFHPSFNQTSCLPSESCFPGTRPKRLSERLTDVLGVAQKLATPNADPTYQANLNNARVASYLDIDAMGATPITTASFYTGLVDAYGHFIDQLSAVQNLAVPANARTAVMDTLCSPENVAEFENMENECVEQDQFCNLAFLFTTISMCDGYQDGATLDQVIAQVGTTKAGLITERDRLALERDQIVSMWSQIQALHPSYASLPATCNIRYPFGTAQLPQSNFAAGQYGADLRYLYGHWEWPIFGVSTSTAKATLYVRDVVNLVRDCIGDVRYGRLDFRRRRTTGDNGSLRDETDDEYYDRAIGDAVGLRAQFADIETHFTSLVRQHAPLVSDEEINTLKTTLSNTQLRVVQLTANRTTGLGWVVVLMQDFIAAAARFTAAQEIARLLIETYNSQFPEARNLIIQELVGNIGQVLDQYGQFFSDEKKLILESLIIAALEEGGSSDVSQAIVNLGDIADGMQAEFDTLWQANEPLGTLASQLKFIFGGCAATSPHPLLTYFGDLPVATRIIQEGSNAQFCGL